MIIDLNADVGEGLDDEELLPFLSSANVACGAHAGSPAIMDRTVALLLARGIRVGAHPGYADRAGFGRHEQELGLEEVDRLVGDQIDALDAIARRRGGRLSHVKAHGALYNRAARDAALARQIARTVRSRDAALALFGLAGSAQVEAARAERLAAVGEAFADRRYLADGALMPRSRPGAVLEDPAAAAAQALQIVRDGSVTAEGGARVEVRARTLCLHGDTPGAARIARAVREALEAHGVRIEAPGSAAAAP